MGSIVRVIHEEDIFRWKRSASGWFDLFKCRHTRCIWDTKQSGRCLSDILLRSICLAKSDPLTKFAQEYTWVAILILEPGVKTLVCKKARRKAYHTPLHRSYFLGHSPDFEQIRPLWTSLGHGFLQYCIARCVGLYQGRIHFLRRDCLRRQVLLWQRGSDVLLKFGWLRPCRASKCSKEENPIRGGILRAHHHGEWWSGGNRLRNDGIRVLELLCIGLVSLGDLEEIWKYEDVSI